jgi:hypothetical protein
MLVSSGERVLDPDPRLSGNKFLTEEFAALLSAYSLFHLSFSADLTNSPRGTALSCGPEICYESIIYRHFIPLLWVRVYLNNQYKLFAVGTLLFRLKLYSPHRYIDSRLFAPVGPL